MSLAIHFHLIQVWPSVRICDFLVFHQLFSMVSWLFGNTSLSFIRLKDQFFVTDGLSELVRGPSNKTIPTSKSSKEKENCFEKSVSSRGREWNSCVQIIEAIPKESNIWFEYIGMSKKSSAREIWIPQLQNLDCLITHGNKTLLERELRSKEQKMAPWVSYS